MAQVRTRKRGKTFSYIFEAGKIDGKRKVVEKGGFPTKAAAYKAGVEAYTDFLHGNIGVTSESITLKDFMSAWLKNVVAVNVKAKTLVNYEHIADKHIYPYLGEIKVQDLTPALFDKWIRNLQKLGLSYNTLTCIHALLHSALNYAVYPAQLVNSNPATYIKVPKNAPRNVIKRHVISIEQFNSLLEKCPFGTPLYIPLLLLYYTGMRIGEVLGLCWEDIDFEQKKINLNRQVVYLRKRGFFLSTLKTKSSERYILFSETLTRELRRWQEKQIENEKALGDSYVYNYCAEDGNIIRQSKIFTAPHGQKIDFVCTLANGRMMRREYVAKILRDVGLNAHSFRHTHATQLIENGATAKGVAERLGHSNALITQNLYTHNTRKLQVETLAIFDKTLQTST